MNNSSKVLNSTPLLQMVGWSLAFGCMALAILIGNSLAIVVLTRKKLLRKRTSYFLLSLAVADMTVGIFSVPTFIYQLVRFLYGADMNASSTLLRIVKALDVFCGLASTFTLTIIALERVYAICFPLRHRTSTRRLYDASVCSVWILAAILSSLYFFHEYNLIEHKVFFWFLILTFFVSMLVMLLAYFAIWLKGRGQQKKLQEDSLHSYDFVASDKQIASFSSQLGKERGRRTTENDRKLAVTVFIVTTVFLLTWLPFHIVNLIIFLKCQSWPCPATPSTDVINFCKLLHYTNSFLNPVIYSLRLQDFRLTLKKIIYRRK